MYTIVYIWRKSPLDPESQPRRQVALDRAGVQLGARQPDVPIGADEVERGAGDVRARQFGVVGRVDGNFVDLQHASAHGKLRRRLPREKQVEAQVVECAEQVLGGPARLQL